MADREAWLKDIYDDDDLGSDSGSGDISDIHDTSTIQDNLLTSLPETAPGVDALLDDETNLYLYILAAAVAAVVFIFVVVILIVSARRQAKDKKKIVHCSGANLQEVKVHNEATNSARNQCGQSAQQAILPGARKQVWTEQGDKPVPHHYMPTTSTRPQMS